MSHLDTNPYASPAIASEPMPVPFASPAPAELATLWQRFEGGIIDAIVAWPVTTVVGYGLDTFMAWTGFAPDTVPYKVTVWIVGLDLGVVILLTLHGYLIATRGQTIGKYIVNTKIVADDGSRMSLVAIVGWRFVPLMMISVVPIIGPLIAVANCLAIFRASRKCFHDDIAGTKVIQIRTS